MAGSHQTDLLPLAMAFLPELRLLAAIALASLAAVSGCKSGGDGRNGGTGGAGAAGGGGSGGDVGALTIDLSASLTEVDVGGVTELSWTISNAASCEANGGWSGSKSIDSATERVAVFRDTDYTLTCSSDDGETASATVEILVFGRLMATVAVSPNPAGAGERALATIIVSNPSDAPVDDVRVDLEIPNNVDPLSEEDFSAGATCTGGCGPGEVLTWLLGTLDVGEVVTLYVFPTIADDIEPGTVLSFAIVLSSAGEAPVEKTATTTEGDRALAVEVTEDKSRVRSGDEIPYTVSYANLGGEVLEDVVIVFVVPASSSLVTASDGGASDPEGVVEWVLAALDPGEGGTFQVLVLSEQALPPGAQLEVKSEGTAVGTRSLATHHTAFAEVPLDVSVALTPAQPKADEQVRVLATTSNRTLATQQDVSISLRVPPGVKSVPNSALSPGGTCPADPCIVGDRIEWALGDLAPGESQTVSVLAVVLLDAGGTIIPFEAQVTAEGAIVIEGTATVVPGDRRVEVRLDESDNPVRPGQDLTYSAHIANQGVVPVDGTLTFRVPSGTTFVSASDGAADVDGVVLWPVDLLPGTGAVRHLRVAVDAGAELGSQLRADVSASLSGSPADARASAYTPVTEALLMASIGLGPNPVLSGERASVAVTVSNPGSTPAADVVVDVRVPPFVEPIDPTQLSQGGTCPGPECVAGDALSWPVGTLAAGEAATVTVPPTVLSSAPDGTLISFDAEVRATDEVPVFVSATTLVDDGRPLDMTVHDRPHPVAPGELVVYVVHIGNTSSDAMDGTVTVPVPDGANFVGASSGGTLNPDGAVEWSIVELSAGRNAKRELAVEVSGDTPRGSQLRTGATVMLGQGDGARVQATEHTAVGPSALLLSTILTPEVAEPTQQVLVDSAVTNTAGGPIDDVTVQLVLPEGIDPVPSGDLSAGGACGGPTCAPGDAVTWSVGTLGTGASTLVGLPVTVVGSAPPGRLITFDFEVGVGGAPLSHASATASVCLGAGCLPLPIQTTYEDGTFDLANWTAVGPFKSPPGAPGGELAAAQIASGGNPGSHLRFSIHGVQVPDGNSSVAWGHLISDQAVHDPMAAGAIDRIDFRFDGRLPPGSVGNRALSLAVQQDGFVWFALDTRVFVDSLSWTPLSISDLQASDFVSFGSGEPGQSANPDFSGVGSPIAFGVSNGVSCPTTSTCSAHPVEIPADIDNFEVVVTHTDVTLP